MGQHLPESGRNRLHYAVLAATVVALGLASRSTSAAMLPDFVVQYAGDTLWALLVYLLLAIALNRSPPNRIAVLAMVFAGSIEVSQLFRPEWLERIRDLPGLRLIFGYGFLWSDLLCYAGGIATGWLGETALRARRIRSRRK